MRPAFKNTATIFLLLLITVPVFYSYTLDWKRNRIRHQMKEKMEHQLLHELTLNNKDIQWFKEGKEIVINNSLFDVKSINYLPGGKARVTGLFDKEETALNEQVRKNQQENNDKGNRQLAQFFANWLALPFEEEHNVPSIDNTVNKFSPYTIDPVSAFRTILTPPPQA